MSISSSVWLVLHDGCPVRAFHRRSIAIDAIVRALEVRLSSISSDVARTSLITSGFVYADIEKWSIEPILLENDED